MPTSLSLSITYSFPFLTCLSVCDLWNEVSASLRSLRETQILRPYPAPTESEALGWHLTSCVLIGVFFFLSRDNLRIATLDWSFLISISLVISPPTVFSLPEIMDFSWQTCFLLLSLLCFHDRGHKYVCLRDKANKINEYIGWVTGTGSERNYGSFP